MKELVLYRQLAVFTPEFDRPPDCDLDGEPARSDQFELQTLPRALDVAYRVAAMSTATVAQ